MEVRGTSKTKPELVILCEGGEASADTTIALGGGGDPLREVADALSSRSLGPDSCVRLLWPRHRCPLLRDDVVLVDTPGRQTGTDTALLLMCVATTAKVSMETIFLSPA